MYRAKHVQCNCIHSDCQQPMPVQIRQSLYNHMAFKHDGSLVNQGQLQQDTWIMLVAKLGY